MEHNKNFQKLSFLVIAGLLILIVILFLVANFLGILAFRIIFYILAGLLLFVLLVLLTGFLGIGKMLSMKQEASGMQIRHKFSTRPAFRFFMPLLLRISGFFHYNSDEIQRVYIQANNGYISSQGKKVSPDKLLVILPHCLQSSRCSCRIRDGLNDCRQCYSCTLGQIKDIINRRGVKVAVATGGSAARKVVQDEKPDFVIAVACERDLSSGIMDVKGIPAYGILNERPNGPCKDTLVNTEELDEIIQQFTH